MNSTLAPKLAIAATLYHVGAFTALHFLQPDVSPISGVLRNYRGWVATSTFFAFAVMWGALAAGLSAGPRTKLIALGRALLGFSACALLLNAIRLATDDQRAATFFLALQNTSRLSLFVGLMVVSLGLRKAKDWRKEATPLLIAATVALVLVLLSRAFLLDWGVAGVGQRGVLVLVYAWSTMVSVRLIKSAGAGAV